MPSPSEHVSKEPGRTSTPQYDPCQPSTSYQTPEQSSYLNVPPANRSFPATFDYGHIDYEADDSAGILDYSYDPTQSMSTYLEDVGTHGIGVLDVPLELSDMPASAASAPLNSYLMGPLSNKSSFAPDSNSPPDGAQFSPPECIPEIVPLSAPMSSETQYIPSPSDHSSSVVEARVTVGQPAARATLKDVKNVQYESPKNHDESWIMRAFYSSSEEFNSPDEWDRRKSAEEEDRQVGAEESDDERASLVDKLFEMLEEAEESGEGNGEEDENDITLVRDAHSTPQASARSSPRQLPHYQQITPAQHISTAAKQYSVQQVPEYVMEPLPSQVSAYGPLQLSYSATTKLDQGVQSMERQPFLSGPVPTPTPLMIYAQPSLQPGYRLPNQIEQRTHQYFRPIPTEYLAQPQTNQNLIYPQIEAAEVPLQTSTSAWVTPAYGQPVQPVVYPTSTRYLDAPLQQELIPQEPRTVPQPRVTSVKRVLEYPASNESESATESELWESVSVRQTLREREVQDEEKAIQTEPRSKGPPFEQKGPTFNKEVKPVPAPPPPSPEMVARAKPLEAMDPQSLTEQIANEMDRLEEIALRKISEYERQEQLDELRKKMCDRFKRFYPALFNDEEEGGTDVEPKSTDEEQDETGVPENGEVIRNGVQLAARYLALWFPDKKERKEMIPWNTLRKIKPIRLCFLDNRIGHGEYESFDIGEFVATTGHMMFAYGDGPEALDDTRLFVLDIIRQQMNMLLRRIWSQIVESQERRVFTYTHIFTLYKKHPIRLRRLVRYLVEQVRVRHMLYRVMADQSHRRGEDYFENRMGVNETGATEVLCLRKRAPHIYYALDKLYPNQLEFLCEERRLQDCDPELAKIKLFLKRRNQHLSPEHKEILDYARRVSYCSRTGRLSSFRAHRFHEFLGFPDLQTDLIYILDFMAREIVMEVTYKAALVHKREQQKNLSSQALGFKHKVISKAKLAAESIEMRHYEEALRSMEAWRKNQDILFGEEEPKIALSYGKNPVKWESDGAYNKREAAERKEFEDEAPVLRRTIYMTSAELFEEHKKVLHGEYWDSSPEDLTKEAVAFANACAEARRLGIELEQPPIPPRWKQQKEKNIQDETERLNKLRAINRQHQEEMRLTEQLVKLMAKNSINDERDAMADNQQTEIREAFDFEKARKAIYTAVRRRKGLINDKNDKS